ncbi:MAG: hypothetical protein FWG34_09440 [Oscillospiraceae bacterium]|nr:hypothetical protein [Oscillospiraceae bacterium]
MAQRYITLPLILPYVLISSILTVVNSFRIFKEIYVIYGNYPPQNLYFLQHYIQNQFLKLNYEMTAAASYVFLFLLCIALVPSVIYIYDNMGQFHD